MEVLDGIVKHPVQQDSMVISVQRHASVRLYSVINRQVVSQHIKRYVRSSSIKIEVSNCFICQRNI